MLNSPEMLSFIAEEKLIDVLCVEMHPADAALCFWDAWSCWPGPRALLCSDADFFAWGLPIGKHQTYIYMEYKL